MRGSLVESYSSWVIKGGSYAPTQIQEIRHTDGRKYSYVNKQVVCNNNSVGFQGGDKAEEGTVIVYVCPKCRVEGTEYFKDTFQHPHVARVTTCYKCSKCLTMVYHREIKEAA